MDFNFNIHFEEMMRKHALDTVLVFGHRNPDGDAAGSVMGLTHYIRMVYPQYRVLPYLATNLDRGPKQFVETDALYHPFEKLEFEPEQGRYAVITCDTATEERIIGKEYYDCAVATMVIDHHISNIGYGDINYVRDSEACAENLALILDWDRYRNVMKEDGAAGIYHPNAADYIYLGLIHDTDHFKRATATTMEAASILLSLHVNHEDIIKTKYVQTYAGKQRELHLMNMVKTEFDGKVAYLKISHEECAKHGITYEDIHPISGLLRDLTDIELAFTMYEEKPDVWRCSFRSDGKWIDVNDLVASYGGGGHAAASGLTIACKEPNELLTNLLKKVKEA